MCLSYMISLHRGKLWFMAYRLMLWLGLPDILPWRDVIRYENDTFEFYVVLSKIITFNRNWSFTHRRDRCRNNLTISVIPRKKNSLPCVAVQVDKLYASEVTTGFESTVGVVGRISGKKMPPKRSNTCTASLHWVGKEMVQELLLDHFVVELNSLNLY